MKKLGTLFMWLGMAMGVVLSIAFLVNIRVNDMPLLTAIGLGKLSFIGAIGVIGPTRINYARIIPMVDYTAKMIGRLIG